MSFELNVIPVLFMERESVSKVYSCRLPVLYAAKDIFMGSISMQVRRLASEESERTVRSDQ